MRTPPAEGERIRVVGELDDPAPLPVGSEGTVLQVYEHEGWFQVSVDWDEESGVSRNLMLLDVDPYEVIPRAYPPVPSDEELFESPAEKRFLMEDYGMTEAMVRMARASALI